MTRTTRRTPLAVAALATLVGAAQAQPVERRSTLEDQQSVAVTIYNADLALVKDARRLTLDRGSNRIALRDVSANMRPETAQLRSLSNPGSFRLLEQNFDFDLLTPATLLEKYVGKTVRIVKTHPTSGAETTESAQVLSAHEGVVLKMGDRIETGQPGRIVFDGVPANLRDRPTLVTELDSQRAGPQDVELSYLTKGLAWRADYVAELSADDRSIDLNGWFTLTNQSGTSYSNAKLQLVAGDVNLVQEEPIEADQAVNGRVFAPPPEVTVSQEALFEYHLYTVSRPTTLADQQTKQVALLNASGVPVTKELVLHGQEHYYTDSVGDIGKKLKTAVYIEFANRESTRLGEPLPKGVVRLYKRDSAGNAQFVGEDSIDHTPKNETVRLHVGDAFDVTADKKQTDWRRRDTKNKTRGASESAYEIVLRNAKPEAVTVTVREPVPGDWTMLEESQKHTKLAAGIAQWQVKVPAEGSATLTYRVLTRY
ncbi:MAG TPA: DUF4139 domain-containing protein [Ideonella sp.]|uniref:DUF4139 domain-containing protein n=1 Tax=Ideonella sp. TaxID=1929293 RepID=UPI002E3561D1|nr:DUF4139 domain-containing protein [Ideonella sp.]HEX5686881.1 DUF4139 domain-containing protein [Ideonella sp.]